MNDIPVKLTRAVATSLRATAVENSVRQTDLARIARKHNLEPGDVIGIARDILIDVEMPKPVQPEEKPADKLASLSKARTAPPVSELVREQILKGGIFRCLQPPGKAEVPSKVPVLTTYGQFRKERQAIKEWTGRLEAENVRLEKQVADLQRQLDGRDAMPLALDDEEIARRDPNSFFMDPRDA